MVGHASVDAAERYDHRPEAERRKATVCKPNGQAYSPAPGFPATLRPSMAPACAMTPPRGTSSLAGTACVLALGVAYEGREGGEG